MDEHLKRQLRELSGAHAAALQAAKASLGTDAVRMALDSHSSLAAMAGIADQISSLTLPYVDAFKNMRLVDLPGIGSQFSKSLLEQSTITNELQETVREALQSTNTLDIMSRNSVGSMERVFGAHAGLFGSSWKSFVGQRDEIFQPLLESNYAKAIKSLGLSKWLEELRSPDVVSALGDLRATGAVLNASLRTFPTADIEDLLGRFGLARYAAVAKCVTSALPAIRTVGDIEDSVIAAFHQVDEIFLSDDKIADRSTGIWKTFTPYEQFSIKIAIGTWLIGFIVMIVLESIQIYLAARPPEPQPLEQPKSLEQPKRRAEVKKVKILAVRGDSINVRSGPNIKGDVIHTLNRGDIVKKIKQRGPWCQVEHRLGESAAVRGWVKCRYVRDVELMVGDVAISVFRDLYGTT